MKAICASVNFDLFMVLPRPTARITHAAKLEFCGPKTGRQVTPFSRSRSAGIVADKMSDVYTRSLRQVFCRYHRSRAFAKIVVLADVLEADVIIWPIAASSRYSKSAMLSNPPRRPEASAHRLSERLQLMRRVM